MEEQFFKISDFATKIGKHVNTVDGWFKKLEEQHIHYINRINNEKVYDQLDLKIALFIKQKREQKWSLDAIFEDLENHFDLRPFPIEEEPKNNVLDLNVIKRQIAEEVRKGIEEAAAAQLKEIKDEYDKMMMQYMVQVEEQYKKIMKHLPDPEDSKKTRQQQITDLITRRRVESILKREALELWEQKPESERLKKVGLFSKIEDVNKRDRFIEEYIDQHFEEYMRKELGIE
ncbi:MerR family transcriptional regulator (plasmid) [Bacillus methanolicus]|uniref:MerR family transcriptional regulator n=1 Tax=Bacillus methanolicus TaxID=1471 RepID=UPI002380AE90|nr:MerR family transcriptional regulator [Bacillus methanolicus]MDE3841098.1 MerR family transcriptional regulator [Bacillus methanolicus]